MVRTFIILGGNSKRNADWIDLVAHKFSGLGSVYAHTYSHWINDNPEIDFKNELKDLSLHLEGLKGDYCIIAKSAGVILALTGINQQLLKPSHMICMGLPLNYAKERGVPLQELIISNKVPTLYIQAEHDPMGEGRAVSKLVQSNGDFMPITGDSHNYAEIDFIVDITANYLKQHSHDSSS